MTRWSHITPEMPLETVLLEAFRHFMHLDFANASVHCGLVRFSPITFRLMEQLVQLVPDLPDSFEVVQCVAVEWHGYEEDRGR